MLLSSRSWGSVEYITSQLAKYSFGNLKVLCSIGRTKRAICSPELSYFSKRYHQNQLRIWKRTSHLGMSRSCAQWQEQKTPVHPNCLNFPNGTTKTNYGFGKGCFGGPKSVLECRGFVLNDKTSVHPNCLNFPQTVSPKAIMDLGKDVLATQRA